MLAVIFLRNSNPADSSRLRKVFTHQMVRSRLCIFARNPRLTEAESVWLVVLSRAPCNVK